MFCSPSRDERDKSEEEEVQHTSESDTPQKVNSDCHKDNIVVVTFYFIIIILPKPLPVFDVECFSIMCDILPSHPRASCYQNYMGVA